MDFCNRCGERSVIIDPSTNLSVCSSCGVEHASDIFQSQTFTSDGRPNSTLVRANYTYRDTKIYHANETISDITSRLGLSSSRSSDVSRMVSDITNGEFGAGDWFLVLVAACSYVTMRRNRLPLSMAEAAAAIGREVHEIGRMVTRVSEHLDLVSLPEFDMAQSLERAVRSCPCLAAVEEEKSQEMLRQGKFILQCAVKWFLTTGRQPLPMVAAVLAFVADVNGVAVDVEEIAKEIYAGVATSKLRKKELVDTLVKAARVLLPWGEDVTAKNLVHNAPLLLRYMELKSKSDSFDMGTFRITFQDQYLDSQVSDSGYFDVTNIDSGQGISGNELGSLKLSAETLSNAYKKAVEGCTKVKSSMEFGKSHGRKRDRRGIVIDARMSCGSNKNPSLEQILARNVGYDAAPPSFETGLEAKRRRKEKIDSAKIRIAQIMKPQSASLVGAKKESLNLDKLRGRRRRGKREGGGDIDWEDCIVELLLLHHVSEEEIEQGQYKRLLDLHIFSSLGTQK